MAGDTSKESHLCGDWSECSALQQLREAHPPWLGKSLVGVAKASGKSQNMQDLINNGDDFKEKT